MKESLARRRILSFSGWKMDDESTTRLVLLAYGLKDLDMYAILFIILFNRSLKFWAELWWLNLSL